MKNLLLFALMAVVLEACEEKDDDKPFMLDPYAFIRIEPGAALVPKSTNPDHLTPLEIVKKGNIVNFYNRLREGRNSEDVHTGGFNGKDTTSAVPAFLFWGTNIIDVDNWGVYYLVEDWLLMEDAVIAISKRKTTYPYVVYQIDTIAYIPNALARKAEAEIRAAWEAQDTEAVYRIFNEAWKFVPVTGAEYRELARQGLQ